MERHGLALVALVAAAAAALAVGGAAAGSAAAAAARGASITLQAKWEATPVVHEAAEFLVRRGAVAEE